MTTYARQIATAKRLIKLKGQAITHVINTAGAYTPASGAPIVTTTQAVFGVPLGNKQKDREGSVVPGRSVEVLLSTDGFTVAPKADDELIIGGKRHNIDSVDALAPDGTDILYTIIATAH